MKTFRILGKGVMAVVLAMSMTACDDEDGDLDVDFAFNLNNYVVEYNADGYWKDCYSLTATLSFDGLNFSHSASVTEWGGVNYYAWLGFCPSRVSDTSEKADDWTNNQWTAITGGGLSGKGTPYMIGFWDVNEDTENIPEVMSCAITKNGAVFDPEKIYITNTAWGYYAMKNGTAFNKKFTESDWCKLHICGVKSGVLTGKIEVLLADGTNILNTWREVDLDALGDVDCIYFQMSSTDAGQWGMNTPAYFVMDRLTIDIQ